MTLSIILAAFFGTIAFSILYDIPKEYLVTCGCFFFINSVSIFTATVAIALVSRYAAVKKKTPEIVFLISGIFPLVPGAGIYWTAYYLVSGQMDAALSSGSGALKTCFAMVLGIVVIHELPQWIFSGKKNKEVTNGR